MPGPNALHRDAVLTNMSVKYRNEAMIWPFILPIVKVGKRSDMFFVYNKADAYFCRTTLSVLRRCRTRSTGV